jgi:hypothetical protein
VTDRGREFCKESTAPYRHALCRVAFGIASNVESVKDLIRALACALLTLFATASASAASPEQAVETYLRAVYARDFAAAYRALPPGQRKPEAEYLAEHPSLSGRALAFAQSLASLVEFGDVVVETSGIRAVVSFSASLPDANASLVRDLTASFDEAALGRLSEEEIRDRHARLADLSRNGSLPTLTSPHEEWYAVQADGRWWVQLEEAPITVRFEGVAMAGLPWQFEPLQREIRASPGETLQATYRMKNLADRPITAKARHIFTPTAGADYLELVTCFCFLEQTLKPQEEIRVPVTFRMSYELPDAVGELGVRYEFYPLETASRGQE